MKTCPVCDTPYPDQDATCPTDGAALIESLELAPGHIVRSKYRIVGKLGRGGMGVVYLAEHRLLGGQVALKFLAAELSRDPQFVKRFRNEARAAYVLRHPNIVAVTDLDQDEDGSLFIAMEYVSGPDLRSVLREAKEPLPVPRVLAIASGVAAGLCAAHARGVVHRDIKPENILLAAVPDGGEVAKVLDFGIAVITEGVTHLSRTNGILLTPPYAAPEQWRGTQATELDGRADLYALGGVLYEMLAGRLPFQAANMEGWMYQHLHGVAEPLGQLRPDLARDYPRLDSLVMRLLAREREQRFDSAAALVVALARVPDIHPSAPFVGAVPTSQAREMEARPVDSSAVVMEQARAAIDPTSPSPPRTRFMKWAVFAALIVAGLGIWLTVRPLPTTPATDVPVLIPSGGTYPVSLPVTISDSTPNAVIHYSVDGKAPSANSPIYAVPLTLANGAELRAMATAPGHSPSADITAKYIWSGVTMPAATPRGAISYDPGNASHATAESGSLPAKKPSKIDGDAQAAVSSQLKPVLDGEPKAEQGEEKQTVGAPPEESEGTTWTDQSTGLMWTRFDNGNDLTWHQAAVFCHGLTFAGHTDWELPTIYQLQDIYKSNMTRHIKGAPKPSGSLWSSSPSNGSEKVLSFNFDGGRPFSSPADSSQDERALCVRRSGR